MNYLQGRIDMFNKYETISNSTSVVTSTIAIANFHEILSIVILVLSIANILFNMCYRIYNHIKNKNVEKISEDITDAQNQLENLKKEGKEDV